MTSAPTRLLSPTRTAGAPRLAVLPAALAALFLSAGPAAAQPFGGGRGKVQGRVLTSDTRVPVPFAEVSLVPADTTGRPAGALADAEGRFRLLAPGGRYTLQVRALSYRKTLVTGVVVRPDAVESFTVILAPEALVQAEIVVEARAHRNTENALLAERKRAAAVGDAVSAEQIRRLPDRDAADVLRRVTGMSVVDDKYVFVRGMGERYSSTEVDGMRVASPEQNKRVLPLDLLPANLLDHMLVQKTYTADRPGDFGGGDVQIRTRDFPGRRTLTAALAMGADVGTTFGAFRTYEHGSGGLFGLGIGSRALPGLVGGLAGGRQIVRRGLDPSRGFAPDTMALLGRSFANSWRGHGADAPTNGSLQQSYGDELRLFGRRLGIVQSASLSRTFDSRNEYQALFTSSGEPIYDYGVRRFSQSVQLGGMAALSYELDERHRLHLRGFYTSTADDEVRTYQGYNFSSSRLASAERLLFVRRTIGSLSLEGHDELPALRGLRFDWKGSLSRATRDEPDRRETVYELYGDTLWALSGGGLGATRHFGALTDDGRGLEGRFTLPLLPVRPAAGRVEVGAAWAHKDRQSIYRRFQFKPGSGVDQSAPPETLFQESRFTGRPGGAEIQEVTRADDNYVAEQEQLAGFVSVDLPLAARLRGIFGLRVERGRQDVRTYDLFEPAKTTAQARLDDTDLLPSVNLVYALRPDANLRLAAARTVSRPDLRELTPGPTLEYLQGLRVVGNPDLERASIANLDLRAEVFPSVSEALAAGIFYKHFDHPIEQTIQPGDAPVLQPMNSEEARNFGLELEARGRLRRFGRALDGLFVNANLSLIRSRVRLAEETTRLGTRVHPLQGQSDILWNAAVTWAPPRLRAVEGTLALSRVGRRLHALGVHPRPDVYEQPHTVVDVTAGWRVVPRARLKLAAQNLFDAVHRTLQGGLQTSWHRTGRSVSLSLSYGL